MTRIEAKNGWYITGESLNKIVDLYYESMLPPKSLMYFVDTSNRDVYLQPDAIIAILGIEEEVSQLERTNVVPAEENNSD